MPMPSLSTLPQDIHYHLLSSLSSFADLAATVLAARPLHTAFQTHRARVLSSVARNFVGGERLFGDALLLVRCQEKAYGYGYDYGSTLTSGVRGRGAKTKNMSKPKAKTKGLSSGTIRLLMGNARVVGELLEVMWGLVREDKQTEIADSGLGLPVPALPASETETIRFNSAAYRFCVYCLLPTADARSAFLKRYPQIEVLELSHLVGALWVLVSVIRGRPAENERDCMSRGPRFARHLHRPTQRPPAVADEGRRSLLRHEYKGRLNLQTQPHLQVQVPQGAPGDRGGF
ncbi:hypothetical protein C8R47DRAFT_1102427 [Mycena vitilis]|nr:hypothetical protein C8R47DRAFT_1102427 [Mycena vitilis]